MTNLSQSDTLRDCSIAAFLILLAFAQTLTAHASLTIGFSLVKILDLSVYYIIPALLWTSFYFWLRTSLIKLLNQRRVTILAMVGFGIVIVPLQRILSLAVDFGLRYTFGLIERVDSALIAEIAPHFVASLPENFLIYLLLIALLFWTRSITTLPSRLKLKSVEGWHWIEIADLEAVCSDKNYVIFKLGGEDVRCRLTSKEAESMLRDYEIIRIHRSLLINPKLVRSVKGIGDDCFQLKSTSGKIYTSSARYKNQIEQVLLGSLSLQNGY